MRLKCACGWEARGTEEEVVDATQEHAREMHNMQATREDILARMEPVPES
jgi:predicted small metal-binding protein